MSKESPNKVSAKQLVDSSVKKYMSKESPNKVSAKQLVDSSVKKYMSKESPNKVSAKQLVDSSVKTAILFLTSDQIPEDENFDFVIAAMGAFDSIKEARRVLYENYYEEILDWWQQ